MTGANPAARAMKDKQKLDVPNAIGKRWTKIVRGNADQRGTKRSQGRQIQRPCGAAVGAGQSPLRTSNARDQKRHKSLETIKKNKNIIERLLKVEWTPVDTVEEVPSFDWETEKKFERFESLIDSTAKTLGLADLCISYERVKINGQTHGSRTLPYIRLTGFRDVDSVKVIHAKLTKRKFRKFYDPPLSLCYEIQRSGTSYLAASPDAYLIGEPQQGTLCGSLAMIGTNPTRRIVTVGGIVSFQGAMWATSAGHRSTPRSASAITAADTLTEETINPEDYDDSIKSALVIGSPKRNEATPKIPMQRPMEKFDNIAKVRLGEVEKTGEDWSLLSIRDPGLAQPNAVCLGSKVSYLTQEAEAPVAGEVMVLAGISGPRRLIMSPGAVRFPLSSRGWITTWKLKYGSNPPLVPGDSGSWVVHVGSGRVFGHIIASNDDYAYLMPLKFLFSQISDVHTNTMPSSQVCIPPAFDMIAGLAHNSYRNGSHEVALKHARESIQKDVLEISKASKTARIIRDFLDSTNQKGREEFLVSVIMQTGADMTTGLELLREQLNSEKIHGVELTNENISDFIELLSAAAARTRRQSPGEPTTEGRIGSDAQTHLIQKSFPATNTFVPSHVDDKHSARAKHANVCAISYSGRNDLLSVQLEDYRTLDALAERLSNPIGEVIPEFTLFVVEDLSYEVMQLLGSSFDVDSSFFQKHIEIPVWPDHQSRREQPNLKLAAKGPDWFQLKFVRSRCFENIESFQSGEREASCFNNPRRLVGDRGTQFRDNEQSTMGLMGSKATLWMKRSVDPGVSTIGIYRWFQYIDVRCDSDLFVAGILLLDATISGGHTPGQIYWNWHRPPPVGSSLPPAPAPRTDSFFDVFVHWARNPKAFHLQCDIQQSTTDVPIQVLLHLICAQWLEISAFINFRLKEVDQLFTIPPSSDLDAGAVAASELDHWRMIVAQCREDLAHTMLVLREMSNFTLASQGVASQHSHSLMREYTNTEAVTAYEQDYLRVLGYMAEHQQRIDRLTRISTAISRLNRYKLGCKDHKNLQVLAGLFTFFTPLAVVASVLSMNTDMTNLHGTVKSWASSAVPADFLVLILLWIFTLPRFGQWVKSSRYKLAVLCGFENPPVMIGGWADFEL
ncbi:hypothetical protein J7T55_013992 [Diaporthe amygdali]|uniref:uncharacterized protein n=1 Tax=Phomopsis amygdali TaxID=1214568 RepID=UPI0022FECFC4|nr:uncharacterized protein J7T55_013992 [Diaporthe amygdali]KAJ0119788.1 hypothetical protein J7T55_013992 [Diaporthe amygdali]